MKYLLTLAIVVVSAGLVFSFNHFKPQTKRKKPVPVPPIVKSVVLQKSGYDISLESFGSVIPEKELTIVSEIQGTVEEKNSELIPGGLLSETDVIAQIDKTNYQLIVRDRQSIVVEAENALALEIGNQTIAQQEYELFKEELVTTEQGRRLVLREPQLKQAQARLDATLGKLDEAILDIKRTTIRAPFNAVILDSFIERGKFLTTHSPGARIAGTDRFWVTLSVPLSSLSFIDIPESDKSQGSEVTFQLNGNNGSPFEKTGHVLRLQGQISSENRMAQLIVGIDDPLDLKDDYSEHFSKILLGSYVRAEIDCGRLEAVYRIPRSALHEQNTIWLLNDSQLEIREIEIAWTNKKDVLVRGDLDGTRLITSRIQNPLRGMSLTESSARKTEGKKKKKP